LPHVSGTFHGRDIFAPAAAHLANGVSPEEFGPVIMDSVTPQFAEVTSSRDVVSGEVLHVDRFGNIITNISSKDFAGFRGSMVQVELAGKKLQTRVVGTYGDARLNDLVVFVGSQGYVEIALNQGNVAEKFQAKPGDKITLSRA